MNTTEDEYTPSPADQAHADRVAEALRIRRARIDAEQAAELAAVEDQAAAAEAAARALPVTDADVDADPDVAALEERIAAGDDTVTEAALAKARVAAAGRSRFGRLRDVASGRKARRDAEELEREQADAAEEHARAALADYTPAALVPVYDEAVRALTAYTDALKARNGALGDLFRLPVEERHRGVDPGEVPPGTITISLDGDVYRREDIPSHLERVFGAAGLVRPDRRYIPAEGTYYDPDRQDPPLIAEGRTQLPAE